MTRTRAGFLSVGSLAALALILVFATSCTRTARAQSSPPGAPAPAVAAAPAGQYVGAAKCKECHEDAFDQFGHTKMGRLFIHQPRNTRESQACETCHGPGKAHVDAGGGRGVGGLITFAKDDKTPIAQRNAICLGCHSKGERLFWQGSVHASSDVACTNCHKVMVQITTKNQLAKPTEIETCGTCHLQKKAQMLRSSHMPLREGKMGCSSCHNPHGSMTPSLLRENSLNDTCYTCHAEKRGPFLWEHAPVPESCANCHDPHGSNHERMLKVARPRLCQQCHITSRHPTNTYGRELRFPGAGAFPSGVSSSYKYVVGSSCQNCHVTIHGSNHPSGVMFTR